MSINDEAALNQLVNALLDTYDEDQDALGEMGFGGLTGDQRRTEVIRRIRQRSNVSGFTGTNVTRWAIELSRYRPTPPRVSEPPGGSTPDPLNVIGHTGTTPATPPRVASGSGGGHTAIKREENEATLVGAVSEEEDGGEDEGGETEDEDEEYDTENTETDSRVSDPDWTPRTHGRR